MSFTPRFSAQRFTRTLSAATGMASGALKNTLSRFGKQGMLRDGTTAIETKAVLRQLEKSGAIEDARAAERIFNKENRVAERMGKVIDRGRREDRLAAYNKERAMGGLVHQQAHKVSAFDTGTGGQAHSVSAFGSVTHTVSAGGSMTTKTSAGMAGGSPLQMARPLDVPAQTKPILKDIPFD